MSAVIRWAHGGDAHVLSIEPHAIVLRSTVPSPPGSRIDGTLADDPSARLRVKIHSSRKQEDGTFLLEGRPIDLPRTIRERLEALSRNGES
jgi:hypothetical protein